MNLSEHFNNLQIGSAEHPERWDILESIPHTPSSLRFPHLLQHVLFLTEATTSALQTFLSLDSLVRDYVQHAYPENMIRSYSERLVQQTWLISHLGRNLGSARNALLRANQGSVERGDVSRVGWNALLEGVELLKGCVGVPRVMEGGDERVVVLGHGLEVNKGEGEVVRMMGDQEIEVLRKVRNRAMKLCLGDERGGQEGWMACWIGVRGLERLEGQK